MIAFLTGAVSFVFGTIFRGVTSLVAMAIAAYLWRRVMSSRGRTIARPATLLFFPCMALIFAVVFALLMPLRLIQFINEMTLIRFFFAFFELALAIGLGLGCGVAVGIFTHLYATRWGRIMIVSSGRHLLVWFISLILATLFMILPYGWLWLPTALFHLGAALTVVVGQATIYLRYKQLQVAGVRTVSGAPIDLSLSAAEAAVVSCLMDLFAKANGAPVLFSSFAQTFAKGQRLQNDPAVGVLPAVRRAWVNLANRTDALAQIVQQLVARGVLVQGLLPGAALTRLLEMGGMTRTVTLGCGRLDDSGTARLATFVQAGGANLLMRAENGRLLLKEVQGGEMVHAIGDVLK